MYGREVRTEILKERDNFENLGVDGLIIIKLDLKSGGV
jgi:hypothetical protein